MVFSCKFPKNPTLKSTRMHVTAFHADSGSANCATPKLMALPDEKQRGLPSLKPNISPENGPGPRKERMVSQPPIVRAFAVGFREGISSTQKKRRLKMSYPGFCWSSHPLKLTCCTWKDAIPEGHVIFQTMIFSGYYLYVNFSDGIKWEILPNGVQFKTSVLKRNLEFLTCMFTYINKDETLFKLERPANIIWHFFNIFLCQKNKDKQQLPLDYANQFLGDFSRVDCKKRGF